MRLLVSSLVVAVDDASIAFYKIVFQSLLRVKSLHVFQLFKLFHLVKEIILLFLFAFMV